jgi:hypothetical protein
MESYNPFMFQTTNQLLNTLLFQCRDSSHIIHRGLFSGSFHPMFLLVKPSKRSFPWPKPLVFVRPLRGLAHLLTGAFYAGLLDGLLGVAGMMTLIVIVDHSRKFPTFSTSMFKNWEKTHTSETTTK